MVTVKGMAEVQLRNEKFSDLKSIAKAEGWVEYCKMFQDLTLNEQSKKANFIGVTKEELVQYLSDIAQQKADIEMMDEIDAEQEALGNPMEEGGSDPIPVVTLKEIASDLKTTEKALRRMLRLKGFKKPGTRWEWPIGHEDIDRIRALKEKKSDNVAAQEQAKA